MPSIRAIRFWLLNQKVAFVNMPLSSGQKSLPIATKARTRGIFMHKDEGENLSRCIKGKPRAP